ncbi:MAG: hypothetical protein IKM29_04905 [Clostridia bacterium]|nr:hypothetical protein [Clostridia bacterium]
MQKTATEAAVLKKHGREVFSAVLNRENAATKKFPQTEAYGLWEFYLYRKKKELAPKATEGECVTMKLC